MDLSTDGFQPCDIRGIYGENPTDPVNPYLIYLVATAIKKYLPSGEKVLISGDGRSSSRTLVNAAKLALGDHADILGIRVPTSMAYLAKQSLDYHSCMIITASHNPPLFNGVKMQIANKPVNPDLMLDIKQQVLLLKDEITFPDFSNCLEIDNSLWHDTWQYYCQSINDIFNKVDNVKIVLDSMHGCFATIAAESLKDMGYSVKTLRDNCCGDFNGIMPDPSVSHNLDQLIELVSTGDYTFGAALDGDGDRACFIDEAGRMLDNGTILYLLAKFLKLKDKSSLGKAIIYDQKIRLSVIKSLKDLGFAPLREKTGHAFIRSRVLQEQAILGGEKSGHFFWNDIYPVPAGDCGLFAIFAIGELMTMTGKTLSELSGEVPESPFYTGDIRDLRYNKRSKLIDSIIRKMPDTYDLDLTDGVRIELYDDNLPIAFGQIRESGTESDMLTATFDAMSAEALRMLMNDLLNSLPSDSGHIKTIINSNIKLLT